MAHERNGVDVKLITGRKEQALVATYVGKYIAKVDDRRQKSEVTNVGRWWGRWNISDPEPREYEITDREAIELVNNVLSTRVGGEVWQPTDASLCSIFGNSMGSGLVGEYAGRYGATHERGSV